MLLVAMPSAYGMLQADRAGEDEDAVRYGSDSASSSLSSPQSSPPAAAAAAAKAPYANNDTIHVLPRTSTSLAAAPSRGVTAAPAIAHVHSASHTGPTAAQLHPHQQQQAPHNPAHAQNGNYAPHNNITATTATTSTSLTPSTAATDLAVATSDAPPKKRRPRKPKEPQDDGKTPADAPPKEKKTRKPREPKIKSEPGATGSGVRRKPKASLATASEEKPAMAASDLRASTGSRQATVEDMFTQQQQQHIAMSAMANVHAQPQPQPQPQQMKAHPIGQTTFSVSRLPPQPASDHTLRNGLPMQMSSGPTPRPISSGQNYDPIRGATIESRPSVPLPPTSVPPSQPSPRTNHLHPSASTSPSIASLLDFSQMPRPSSLSAPHYSRQASPPQPPSDQLISPPSRKAVAAPYPPPTVTVPPPVTEPVQPTAGHPLIVAALDGAMDIDAPEPTPSTQPPTANKMIRASSSTSSAAGPKVTKQAQPKGTGSGLLSSSNLFGGPSSSSDADADRGPDIYFTIPLKRDNNVINIAQLIAHNYGHDAINPRAAAHRRRLRDVAAAAKRLEPGLADEMDSDSDLDADNSNVEMGGLTDDAAANPDPDKPAVKRRKRKSQEYDKEDDFIDDTELAWEQQARIASDGFFVYSGPLVKEIAANEAAAAPPNARTSGRGRGGRGSRGSRTAAGANTHAGMAADKEKASRDTNANSTTSTTTGRGRSRGGRSGQTGTKRGGRVSKKNAEVAAATTPATPAAAASAAGGAPALRPVASPASAQIGSFPLSTASPSRAVPHASSPRPALVPPTVSSNGIVTQGPGTQLL